MNQAIKEELGADPLEEAKDEHAQKKSLRNQFNFQERSSQTFNMPFKQAGIKTNPPVCMTFSLETTQWMIFDSYLQNFEDMQRQEMEEQMKNKKDKKPV
jgi:dynein intermediate chain 1